jgi:hypothetical protein
VGDHDDVSALANSCIWQTAPADNMGGIVAMTAAQDTMKPIPWWKEPTKDQWLAWWAAWLGWTLDAFDFTMFLLIMVPISQEFNVPLTEVAFVLSVTLWLRLVGAVGSGWLADRVGRKIPLMISILWYSLANFAAGFSPTFAYLFLFRALLGIGMGAEWPAGRRTGDGNLAGPFARHDGRHSAGLMGPRLHAVERPIRPILLLHRMARHAVGRRLAGAFRLLRPQIRQRAADLAREPPAPAR